MSDIIELSSAQKDVIVPKIKSYFEKELDQEIGAFDAEFLLDFFSKEIGGHFYNKGIQDSLDVVNDRVEGIKDSLYVLEKPLY